MSTGLTAVPLDHQAGPAPERSVTILGATGSIGASTIDLIKRERSRYRVEALSANTNATALAALARELNARFAAIADPSAGGRAVRYAAAPAQSAGPMKSCPSRAATTGTKSSPPRDAVSADGRCRSDLPRRRR